jgi:hypothetical protein
VGSYAQKAVFKRVYKAPKQSEVIILAKDGTARGGARPGSGPKRKALTEKISAGKTAQVIELPEGASLEGVDMPPVKEYMKAKQKNGGDLCAEEIFAETWVWLKKVGCTDYVNTQLVNQYAMSVARQIQCEQCISEYGFLAKHPTTGAACQSPYVAMLQQFTKQANQSWYQIYQIVRENCSVEYSGSTPADDVMERLLRSRKGT